MIAHRLQHTTIQHYTKKKVWLFQEFPHVKNWTLVIFSLPQFFVPCSLFLILRYPLPFFNFMYYLFTKIANGTCNDLLNARSYVYIVKQTCRMGSVMCQRNDEQWSMLSVTSPKTFLRHHYSWSEGLFLFEIAPCCQYSATIINAQYLKTTGQNL